MVISNTGMVTKLLMQRGGGGGGREGLGERRAKCIFSIINFLTLGEVPFNFTIALPEGDSPFKVTPTQGTLQPQENTTLDLAFTPREAAPCILTALCSVSGITRALTLRGVAKYPFLAADVQVARFGDVLVGRTIERTVTLRNLSAVKTAFRIRRIESDCESQFAFATYAGRIGAMEDVPLKVAFTATTSGVYSSDTFEISTPAGITTIIRYTLAPFPTSPLFFAWAFIGFSFCRTRFFCTNIQTGVSETL
jgi:hypothetical protein